jgi:hypothetical protein
MPRLPSEKDFAPCGDLDAQDAWRNFGGLTLEAAQEKLAENPDCYCWDFYWMGSKAFAFYYPVIDAFLRESAARGEANCFHASSLGYAIKWQFTGAGLRAVKHLAPRALDLAHFVLANIDLFDPDREPELDVAGAWRRLEEHLRKVA